MKSDYLRDQVTAFVDGPLAKRMRSNETAAVKEAMRMVLARNCLHSVASDIFDAWHKRLVSATGRDSRRGWSDGTWAVWMKFRFDEVRTIPTGKSMMPSVTTAVLHVFFLSVEETEEHLLRLRNKDKTPVKRGPDTPGIERRDAPLGPIDRVAARVVPDDHHQG